MWFTALADLCDLSPILHPSLALRGTAFLKPVPITGDRRWQFGLTKGFRGTLCKHEVQASLHTSIADMIAP